MWNPPSTAGVLSILVFQVNVISNDTGAVIISSTTTNTYYPLPIIQLCHYYIANVTAFTSKYHGVSVVTKQRATGGV